MDERPGDVLNIEELATYPKIPNRRSTSLLGKAKFCARRLAAIGVFAKLPLTAGWKRREGVRQISRIADLDLSKVRPKGEGQGRPESKTEGTSNSGVLGGSGPAKDRRGLRALSPPDPNGSSGGKREDISDLYTFVEAVASLAIVSGSTSWSGRSTR